MSSQRERESAVLPEVLLSEHACHHRRGRGKPGILEGLVRGRIGRLLPTSIANRDEDKSLPQTLLTAAILVCYVVIRCTGSADSAVLICRCVHQYVHRIWYGLFVCSSDSDRRHSQSADSSCPNIYIYIYRITLQLSARHPDWVSTRGLQPNNFNVTMPLLCES